jgi:hypothetical protein
MFFGALLLWSSLSFTGNKTAASAEATPAGAPSSDDPSEPGDGVPAKPIRFESVLFSPALRVEAEAKLLRLVDLSAPRAARAWWIATAGANRRTTQRQVWRFTTDRCRAKDMRFLAQPVQAHSPPARR